MQPRVIRVNFFDRSLGRLFLVVQRPKKIREGLNCLVQTVQFLVRESFRVIFFGVLFRLPLSYFRGN
jgi:hypothetical protein